MDSVKGSMAFQYFSYGAFFFFALHVFIQWMLSKLIGPYGKKSTVESPDNNSNEALEVNNKKMKGQEKTDDGFKDVDLTN